MNARTLVVAGHGMAGHRLVEEMLEGDRDGAWRVVVLAEEPRPAYDRVALSTLLAGASPGDLALADPVLGDPRLRLRLRARVTGVDRAGQTVTCADGTTFGYDALVLATGSRPFVPPVPGRELPGCFVYRTVEDVDAIREAARPGRDAVVVGGGLLGLEAAGGLRRLGMRPHVVEAAPWLMAQQIDAGGARVLAGAIGRLGVRVHCGTTLREISAGADGRVDRVELGDGTVLDTPLVVFSAGVRPRDELADRAGLARAERGGFLVDEWCRTEDERVWAIGECAAVEGRCYGLAAPGYRMAETVARQLLGAAGDAFTGADTSAKLKLLGVDVAGFGDSHARTPGAVEYVREDRRSGTYAKLVLASDGRTLLGGVLAGDSRAYPVLRALTGRPLTASPDALLAGAGTGA
ncbi:FAD-dependent oxidoreductase [Streptomyces sp. NPDC018964]|uniref:FAD-dependent oxidoreductase n=1 Tax=unclassified Streptomyces TaxID=2593676 RepID=UPI0037884386